MFVRENQAPFINKELRKAIHTRSRLRNIFCKNPTKENEKKYKIQRNKCMSLRKKSIEKYFKNISKEGVVSTKNFCSMTKPFLTNKGHINGEGIILKCDNETITESSVLAEMLITQILPKKHLGKSQVILLTTITFLILDKL